MTRQPSRLEALAVLRKHLEVYRRLTAACEWGDDRADRYRSSIDALQEVIDVLEGKRPPLEVMK